MTRARTREDGYRRWTLESVTAAIREWFELYGEPPRKSDWEGAMCRIRAEAAFEKGMEWLARAVRYESSSRWPPARVVDAIAGSWNAAIALAGLTPRQPGQRTRRGTMPSPFLSIFGHVVAAVYVARFGGEEKTKAALLRVARVAERLASGMTDDELVEFELMIRDEEEHDGYGEAGEDDRDGAGRESVRAA